MLSDRNEIGVPQLSQKVRVTPGDELKVFGKSPSHRHCVSCIPIYVVIGAEHWRRQLSQWQFTQAFIGCV